MNYKFKHIMHYNHRKSIRLRGYDYSQEGIYFVTICCQDRIWRFGEIFNGEMTLNDFGRIAHDEWLKTPQLRPKVALGACIIMPNHMHGIIHILDRRGELHSPKTEDHNNAPIANFELHSPKTEDNNYAPIANFELHSPKTEDHNNAPIANFELHSPKTEDHNNAPISNFELHSPKTEDNNYAPIANFELHSPDEMGEHATPNALGELRFAPTLYVPNHRFYCSWIQIICHKTIGPVWFS